MESRERTVYCSERRARQGGGRGGAFHSQDTRSVCNELHVCARIRKWAGLKYSQMQVPDTVSYAQKIKSK